MHFLLTYPMIYFGVDYQNTPCALGPLDSQWAERFQRLTVRVRTALDARLNHTRREKFPPPITPNDQFSSCGIHSVVPFLLSHIKAQFSSSHISAALLSGCMKSALRINAAVATVNQTSRLRCQGHSAGLMLNRDWIHTRGSLTASSYPDEPTTASSAILKLHDDLVHFVHIFFELQYISNISVYFFYSIV